MSAKLHELRRTCAKPCRAEGPGELEQSSCCSAMPPPCTGFPPRLGICGKTSCSGENEGKSWGVFRW